MKLLALLLIAALPALAEEEKLPIPGLYCRGEFCIIPAEVVDAMIQMHNEHVQEIRDLKAKGPKCAEVEVTEPSKNPAPKKLPPIPKESDS